MQKTFGSTGPGSGKGGSAKAGIMELGPLKTKSANNDTTVIFIVNFLPDAPVVNKP